MKINQLFTDPYAKVSLMCEGKRIKKRKTSVKKCTLSPVYNEAMVFDVPRENVDDIHMVIKVIDYDRYVGRGKTNNLKLFFKCFLSK